MQHYDHIVVGSGISGLTLTLLLARQDKKVLLLEKAPHIGGSIARFKRNGVPFDVGFHFTGGFQEDGSGMFDEILRVLELDDVLKPRPLSEGIAHRIAFPSLGLVHEIPCGVGRYRQDLYDSFPKSRKAIDRYFDRFLDVCNRTASMSIRGMAEGPPPTLDGDFITLQEVLDEQFEDKLLKALLSGFCMCHGSRPDEISFANHARIAYALYHSTARVKDGGGAFVSAFRDAFQTLDVDVRCKTTIGQLADIQDRRVNRFILSDGEELTADSCTFTIHPRNILDLIPAEHTTNAFRHRIEDFEPSAGFFSIFGTLDESVPAAHTDTIFSIFPGTDMNEMMSPGYEGHRPLAMLCYDEEVRGNPVNTMTAFELSLAEEVQPWANTCIGRRGKEYAAYKKRRVESILERLSSYMPELDQGFSCLDSASMLTFRDYLNSPYGAAYGIKQKVGQFNLVGKLPLRNLYAAGQSAILPGVLGAMTSAFFIARPLLGKEQFQNYIDGKLCR